jgi:hypothetical protein
LLERPFFIMSRIDGGQVPSVMNLEPYGEHASAIGQGVCDLGRIAAAIRRRFRSAVLRSPAPPIAGVWRWMAGSR